MRGALEETMISLQYHFGRAVSDSIAVVELTEVRHKETRASHPIASRPIRSRLIDRECLLSSIVFE